MLQSRCWIRPRDFIPSGRLISDDQLWVEKVVPSVHDPARQPAENGLQVTTIALGETRNTPVQSYMCVFGADAHATTERREKYTSTRDSGCTKKIRDVGDAGTHVRRRTGRRWYEVVGGKKMPPRRVPPGVVVHVCLKRVTDYSRNTWVLLGTEDLAHHHQGSVSMETSVFRQSVAYVDADRTITMDATGAPLLDATTTLFRIGALRVGHHTLCLSSRHCSCKSYQYLRTERGDRNCKHLNSLVTPSYVVEFTGIKYPFQLLSETVPKQPSVYTEWLFSQKHNGLRVRVDGAWAWTRGGMKIDLSSLGWTPPAGQLYDAELCTQENEPSHHDAVLAYLLSGKLPALRLLIFDLVDLTGTLTCGQRLLRLWALPVPPVHLVRYHMVYVGRGGSTFHSRLAGMQIGTPACEGVVVRNPDAVYDVTGRRSNRAVFKVKLAQWEKMK